MSAGAAETVVVERSFAHPAEKVWRALTQQWLLSEWLMPNDFAPELGRRFKLTSEPMPHWDGVVEGEVLEVEPHHRLVYSWNTAATDGGAGLRTVVTWTITPTEHGVTLRIEQSGFRADQPDNLRGARFGWQRNLERLAKALDKQP
jgi:uncharacterized protein YndB with AHSA1/START domain